jgi:small-conductance mechanosensitive channel
MPKDVPYQETTEALQRLTWQQIAAGLAVIAGFLLIAKFAGWLLRRNLSKGIHWGGPIFALSKLLTYFLVLVGVISGLTVMGLPLSSLLLTSSALLVGLGFSLQRVAQDFIAGVVILVEQPIRKDDYVSFGSTAGRVQEIGLRATQLRTVDGVQLVIPNHLLITKEVSNHSYPLKRARLRVEVPASLSEDVDTVRGVLADVARAHPEVLPEPPPDVRLEAILQSHFQFAVIVWVSEPPKTLRIGSELRFSVAQAFAEHGIKFPSPEILVQMRQRQPAVEGKDIH